MSALGQHGHHVVAGLAPTVGEDADEVLLQLRGSLQRAVHVGVKAQQVDRQAVELRNVGLRQADQRGDDPHRDRHEDFLDEVCPLGVAQPLDRALHQRSHQLGLPPPHRRTGESEFVQFAVDLVLRILHFEDGRALQRTDDRLVAFRAERLVVGEHRLHRVEGVCREDLLAFWGILEDPHLAPTGVNGCLRPQLLQHRVWRRVAIGAHACVEFGLCVLDALRQFSGHFSAPTRSGPRSYLAAILTPVRLRKSCPTPRRTGRQDGS